MKLPLLDDIIAAVREAGELVIKGAAAKDVQKKGDSDYVTDSDLAVQNFLREKLTAAYPEIGFLAEEAGAGDACTDGLCWVLDPIDGTMNFIRDLSLSAVSLALVRGGETVMGVVYNPFSGETFYAEQGRGAYLNGSPIRVSDQKTLEGGLAAFGTSPYKKPYTAKYFELYRELFLAAADVRRLGSAALDICYVAAGRFDCYFEYTLSIWDYAAAHLILTEAGGKITDPRGEVIGGAKKSGVLATNGHLHENVLDIIKKYD